MALRQPAAFAVRSGGKVQRAVVNVVVVGSSPIMSSATGRSGGPLMRNVFGTSAASSTTVCGSTPRRRRRPTQLAALLTDSVSYGRPPNSQGSGCVFFNTTKPASCGVISRQRIKSLQQSALNDNAPVRAWRTSPARC